MAEWDEFTLKQFARFEEMGEAQVRAALENNTFGGRRPYAKRWLANLEVQRGEKEENLQERAVIASEISANTATQSAKSSRNSAIWAAVATVIALAALVVPFLRK